MIKKILSSSKLRRIWNDARDAAGPRYTRDINIELPIKKIFDGIGRTQEVFDEIEDFRKKLRDAHRSISYLKPTEYKDSTLEKNLKRIKELGKIYLATAERFGSDQGGKVDLKSIIQATNKIAPYFLPIQQHIWEFERKEDDEQKEKAKAEGKEYLGNSESEQLRSLKTLERTLREFDRAVRNIDYFAKSHKAQLLNDPILLVLGQAGMGKTHLVCDVTKIRLSNGLPPTIIILGEKLLNINDSLEAILNTLSIKGSKKEVLSKLNKAGKKAKRRSLIIVDAINEADRRGWKSGVRKLIKEVKKYPWVGLVMTCRMPFQYLYLPKGIKIITEHHQGFEENELEAMSVFFNFYGLPLPQVPLLISEFSSPLFLSCFCKTAQKMRGGKVKVAKEINDLALGQAGMTKILEDFYIEKERWIVKKHSAKYKDVIKQFWIWNKFGNNCLVKNIATIMAYKGRRYLTEDEVLGVIKDLSGQYTTTTCSRILRILIEEGVLIRDATWDNLTKKYFDVVKFSFHKFSDHIIARYLLDSFFDSKKAKESLSATNSLGNLFSTEQNILTNIDLIEALMVEFPERIKKVKSLTEKDLIDYLPKEVRKEPQVISAFIGSLYWRKPENFINSGGRIKKSILDYINNTLLRYENSRREFLDLFVSTATKPFHPLNAEYLNKYLQGFTLSGRDLFWSEYIRKQFGSGSIYKLISWIENQPLEKMATEQAACVIIVLAWTLGTNITLLRNRATRCLYIIGKIHPEEFFKALQNIVQIEDPYIRERILAAGYGISMAIAHYDKKLISELLLPNAKKIYTLFFKKGARLGTTNVLIRDYARGIIEVVIYNNNKFFSSTEIKRIRPPYADGGLRRWDRSKDKDSDQYREGNSPLGWEFEKDTLRHLVDSRPYDDKDKKYIRLKENIMWRIYQLGYSLKKFGDIDKEIARNTGYDRSPNYAGKIERYGEKYAFIAYREILGLKIDRKEYGRSWVTEDGRSSEFEIDASFPQSSKSERLSSEQLTSGPINIKKWMIQKNAPDISSYLQLEKIGDYMGPWILVDGIIGEKNTKISRKISTFIYGVLVDKTNSGKIEEFLLSVPFPGNDNLPTLPEVGNFFAGELGWREKNTPDSRQFIKIQRGELKRKLNKKEKRWHSIGLEFSGGIVIKEKKKPPEFITEPIYEKVAIERFARWFATKDYAYLGKDDDTVGLHIPSRKIFKKFKLHCATGSFYLCDKEGNVVAIPHSVGDKYGTHENLLYIKKDLLDHVLKKSGKKMLIVTWGERQYWPENLNDMHRSDHSEILENHQNIYKKVFQYPLKKSSH